MILSCQNPDPAFYDKKLLKISYSYNSIIKSSQKNQSKNKFIGEMITDEIILHLF